MLWEEPTDWDDAVETVLYHKHAGRRAAVRLKNGDAKTDSLA